MTLEQLEGVRLGVSAGAVVLLLAAETAQPFYKGRTGRLLHSARNIGIAAVNAAVLSLFFVGPLAFVAAWAENNGLGLLNVVDWPVWVEWTVALVAFDFWMYWWHRANHRLAWLRLFHRMHHTDPAMDVTTAVRFHTGEIVLSSLLRAPVVVLLGMSIPQLIVYEVIMVPVVYFHHSNVALPARADCWMRRLVVSPNMHRVHHSFEREERDSNYGSILTIWDRLLGSYRWRGDPEAIRIGIPHMYEEKWFTFWGMLKTPIM